jgi:hypothetical protein
MVIARIYDEAPYLPDLAIKGMDGLTPTYLCFTQWDNVVDDDRRAVSQAHADSHAGSRTADPQATDAAVALDRLGLAVPAPVSEILHQVGFLREVELAELRDAAAQPDLAGRGVGEVDGN